MFLFFLFNLLLPFQLKLSCYTTFLCCQRLFMILFLFLFFFIVNHFLIFLFYRCTLSLKLLFILLVFIIDILSFICFYILILSRKLIIFDPSFIKCLLTSYLCVFELILNFFLQELAKLSGPIWSNELGLSFFRENKAQLLEKKVYLFCWIAIDAAESTSYLFVSLFIVSIEFLQQIIANCLKVIRIIGKVVFEEWFTCLQDLAKAIQLIQVFLNLLRVVIALYITKELIFFNKFQDVLKLLS